MKKFLTIFSAMIFILSAVFLTACGSSGGNEYLASDLGILELYADYISLGKSIYVIDHSVNPFTFIGDNEDDYCVCTIEKGYFELPDGSKAKEITLRSNETGNYVWAPWSKGDVNFISITVKENEHIIGYVVIKHAHGTEIIKSRSFPKVDGEYQDVTPKQIDKILKNVRKLNKTDPLEDYYA